MTAATKKPAPNSLEARRAKYATTAIDDREDSIILSVKLRSGAFDSSIEVPLNYTDAERGAFVDAWLSLMAAALKCAKGTP